MSSRGAPLFDPDEPFDVATFFVEDEAIGFDIMRITEIVRPVPLAPIPGAADGVSGVMQLRGALVPVVDARARFGLAPRHAAAPDRRFVVMRVDGVTSALVVDRVGEVLRARRRDVRLARDALTGEAARLFVGLVAAGDRIVFLPHARHFFHDALHVEKRALSSVSVEGRGRPSPTAGTGEEGSRGAVASDDGARDEGGSR